MPPRPNGTVYQWGHLFHIGEHRFAIDPLSVREKHRLEDASLYSITKPSETSHLIAPVPVHSIQYIGVIGIVAERNQVVHLHLHARLFLDT